MARFFRFRAPRVAARPRRLIAVVTIGGVVATMVGPAAAAAGDSGRDRAEPPRSAMRPAGVPGPARPALVGTHWRLVGLGGRPLTPEEVEGHAYFILDADGRAVGSTGCNRFFGPYRAYADRLFFERGGTTRMACEQPRMRLEQRFLDLLSRTARQRQDGGRLELLDSRGEVLGVFEGGGASAAR